MQTEVVEQNFPSLSVSSQLPHRSDSSQSEGMAFAEAFENERQINAENPDESSLNLQVSDEV